MILLLSVKFYWRRSTVSLSMFKYVPHWIVMPCCVRQAVVTSVSWWLCIVWCCFDRPLVLYHVIVFVSVFFNNCVWQKGSHSRKTCCKTRQFNGCVPFKLPPSQLQTAQHARKGKVFHSWHLLTQTYFLLSPYVRTRTYLIHTISSTSLHLNNLRDRWVSIGSSFLILHLLYNTLLTCIYLSSLHASWLWTNTFIQWVLE